MWLRTGRSEADRAAARVARIVTVTAAIVFLLVVTRWRPWDLFDRAGYSADFYDEQARSFWRGRLSVRPEVATIEGFLVDGRTYLYYGPFLAIARLPFALFGDLFAGRLVRISLLAAFVTLCTATFHLGRLGIDWWSMQRPARDATHDHLRIGTLVAAVAGSPALFLTGWVSVYHETELWAATFAVWAMVGALRFANDPTRRHALLTGGAVVAAVLTRATVGIGIAVGVVAIALSIRRRAPSLSRGVLAACLGGIGLHMALNVARFGSLLSLPATDQVLTLQNPDRAAWFAGNDGSFFGLRFLPTTLVQYLRPDTIRFERLLPFIRFGPPASDLGSYPVESNTPASSLTATATLLVIAAVIGLVVLARGRAWHWLALAGGAALASAPSFAIGFIANRYLVDMLPLLIVLAAPGVAAIAVPASRGARRLLAVGVGALVLFGLWSNVALATWTQNIKEPGFVALRYDVDDLLFGDPAPGLIELRATTPVPRDGVVGIDPACAGVYVAEQGRWVALERDGTREVSGPLRFDVGEGDGDGPDGDRPDRDETVVATGPDWRIVASRDDDRTTVTYRLEVGGDATMESDPISLHASAPLIDLVVDPVIPEFSLTSDGQPALFGFEVPAGPIEPGAAFDAEPASDGETLCVQLQARR